MNLLVGLLTIVSIGFTPILASEFHHYQDYEDFKEVALSSAAGTPWSPSRHVEIVKKAHASQLYGSSVNYPLSVRLLRQGIYKSKETIPLFVYDGTISSNYYFNPEITATKELAIAFDYQRTYNRKTEGKENEIGEWEGPLPGSKEVGEINIFHKKNAVLNGAVVEIPMVDLLELSERYVGYGLKAVVVTRWADAIDDQKEPEFFVAYTFEASKKYCANDIYPEPRNFLSQAGSLSLLRGSQYDKITDYEAMWWGTTYLSDEKTLVNVLPFYVPENQCPSCEGA